MIIHLSIKFNGTDMPNQKLFSRFNLPSADGEADRKVPLQPLVFQSKDGIVSRYNLRKVKYHLFGRIYPWSASCMWPLRILNAALSDITSIKSQLAVIYEITIFLVTSIYFSCSPISYKICLIRPTFYFNF